MAVGIPGWSPRHVLAQPWLRCVRRPGVYPGGGQGRLPDKWFRPQEVERPDGLLEYELLADGGLIEDDDVVERLGREAVRNYLAEFLKEGGEPASRIAPPPALIPVASAVRRRSSTKPPEPGRTAAPGRPDHPCVETGRGRSSISESGATGPNGSAPPAPSAPPARTHRLQNQRPSEQARWGGEANDERVGGGFIPTGWGKAIRKSPRTRRNGGGPLKAAGRRAVCVRLPLNDHSGGVSR